MIPSVLASIKIMTRMIYNDHSLDGNWLYHTEICSIVQEVYTHLA